jgi:hypothetical protein
MPRGAIVCSQRQPCNSFDIRVLCSEGHEVGARSIEKAAERLTLFGLLRRFAPSAANTLAFPADVVPPRAVATVWGLASVGAGLGGAFFQHASGLTVAYLRPTLGVASAYHTVFVAYGVLALVGLTLVLFPMGPLMRDETLD